MGDVRIWVEDDIVALAGAKKHRLLSRLALSATEPVTVEALIDALWGEAAPRTAKQSVHVHISHIRDRLRPHGAEHLIDTTADGRYRLGIPTEALDVAMFDELARQGLQAARSANHRRARDVLADALGQWAEPFVALQDHPGAIAERQRLTAVEERVTDTLAESLIALGELDDAVPLLRSIVAGEPLRERPYELLMRLYLDTGETGLAIATYDAVAATLEAALGISPSAPLRHLLDRAKRGTNGSTSPVERVAEIDVTTSSLIQINADTDSRTLVDEVVAAAGAQHRQVAHARLGPEGETLPLSPITELAGVDNQVTRQTLGGRRFELYLQLTEALVSRHSVAPVLLLEGLDRASRELLDYLAFSLDRPGPAPFTLIGTIVADELSTETAGALQALGLRSTTMDLPTLTPAATTQTVTSEERQMLEVLSCATLPVPAEVVVRASKLSTGEAATAIERLLARSTVTSEVGGALGLREPNITRAYFVPSPNRLPRQHLALARAIDASTSTPPHYQQIAGARHRLRALPAGDPAAAWTAALGAAMSLAEIGAYGDVVELLGPAQLALTTAEDTATTLQVRVELGRAQIRSGMSVEGLATLESALPVARTLDEPTLFAEIVRCMLEERAPQRSADTTRDLVAEALDCTADQPSVTRIQLMTDLANSWYLVDQARAEALAHEAVAESHELSSAATARALTGLLQASLRPDNAEDRLGLCVEAQQHARRSDSIESLVLALTYEACALLETGQPRRAAPPLRYAEALAADVQVPRFRWWAAAWTALVEFALGDIDGAETRFHQAYQLWPTSTRADPFECFAAQIAALRFVQGRGAELLPALAEMDIEDNIGFLAPLALAQAQAEQADTIDTIEQLLSLLASCENIMLPYGLALAAEAAWHVGYVDAGERLAGLIQPIAHVYTTLNVWGGGGFHWGALRHGYGLALALGGDAANARSQLDQAAGEQSAAGLSIFAARSRDVAAGLRAS